MELSLSTAALLGPMSVSLPLLLTRRLSLRAQDRKEH